MHSKLSQNSLFCLSSQLSQHQFSFTVFRFSVNPYTLLHTYCLNTSSSLHSISYSLLLPYSTFHPPTSPLIFTHFCITHISISHTTPHSSSAATLPMLSLSTLPKVTPTPPHTSFPYHISYMHMPHTFSTHYTTAFLNNSFFLHVSIILVFYCIPLTFQPFLIF